MKYRFVKLFAASIGLLGMSAGATDLVGASEEPNAPYIYSADNMPYELMGSRRGGPESAVLFGDPSKPGPYVMRLKLPAKSTVPPHYHNDELKIATLISGSIGIAYGEEFDKDALNWLKPGDIWTEPKGHAHFGLTGEEGAVLDLHGIGPVSTVSVD